MTTLLVIFFNVNVPDSSCHNTQFNLNQTGFIIADDMKQNEEDSSLRVSTLNNVKGVFGAKDAKVRKFVLTGRGHFTCDLFPRKQMYLTSLATTTPFNLIQKVSVIADDTKQNEEGNSLRGRTLNNANVVSDAEAEDAKVRMLRQIV